MSYRTFFALPLIAFALAACQTTTTAPDRFAQADADSSGSLSKDEANDYMVTTIFTVRDKDQDGSITLQEWGIEEDAKQFKLRDANKDGSVTMDEAKAYARKAGSYDAQYTEADTNKDGKVTREEAVAYYDSKEGPVR